MATIKAKNSAGEWVDVAASDSYERKASSFKMVWVPCSADRQTYDLSSYLWEGDDFILAFTYGDMDDAYGKQFQWLGSEGRLRETEDSAVINIDNTTMANHSPMDMIGDKSSRTNIFEYDGASRKFSINTTGYNLGKVAALIYAG